MHDTNTAVLDVTPGTSDASQGVGRYQMDTAAANKACAERGATTDRERAALMGVTVKTMYRWRRGETPPRLDIIESAARNLGLPRRALFPGI